ncbi:alpha-rhamnosidase [Paenibacillus sp. FSL H8-0548]|uniref:alpha-L-rhamnosidase-related protein n=1 Tax=Paenibacillus sp. FSL H8-0548 TaxID=1920422 RepID=UPI00096F9A52|nr:family 78 glycoside hydrolase catalytic domain [Paenibacillus sp. FSL H8-0548]OMF38850.1 alpha-rhamnosidase [Paenibacillus sp. FSL H8-0548]
MEKQMNRQVATWIWYPGEFEIRLHEKMSVARRARGVMYPAYWRLDRHYSNIKFRYSYELEQDEQIQIIADGTFSFYLDGMDNYRSSDSLITLPAGRHEISISVFNDVEVPALFIDGPTVRTDSSWEVTSYQNDWKQAGSWSFDSTVNPPSRFRLPTTPHEPVKITLRDGYPMVDFGRETFGYLRFHNIKGNGAVRVYYGESIAEALSTEDCVNLDRFEALEAIEQRINGIFTLNEAKAFRYVWIQGDPDVSWESVSMLYEYVPVEYRSSFECSDPKLNEIYDISLYTLQLNTREFFLDGIKRDRWVWGGDAYQAFLMNYYSFFDLDVTRRTLVALRGKDPITMHINTILDYTLYWFISLYDYHLYTGDFEFIRQYYDRAVSLMDFCLKQLNEEGLVEGRKQDWVFVDWADFNNEGAVSTEQILLARSLEAMSRFAALMGDDSASGSYGSLAEEIKSTTLRLFWDEGKGGLLHHRVEGETKPTLTKHASMFAMTYGYLSPEQRDSVVRNVMLNPDVPKIRTPYMRFHELAVLCESGEHDYVRKELLSYWGGMIDLGATTFWEEYDPSLADDDHYGMYGMKFGKSLCHAWGAGPIYLLGKYFLGVTPTSPGYESYRIAPNLGGLEYMKGKVPTGTGQVSVEMDLNTICVESTTGTGILAFFSSECPKCNEGEPREIVNGSYELTIEAGKKYHISYQPTK